MLLPFASEAHLHELGGMRCGFTAGERDRIHSTSGEGRRGRFRHMFWAARVVGGNLHDAHPRFAEGICLDRSAAVLNPGQKHG